MTKAYTANFKEKTGSTSGEEPVYLLEITHPQLAVPVRVARDTQDLYRGVRLSLPGANGNYASTPDSAAVSVTGDIDIRGKFTAPDWTPSPVGRTLFAKYHTTPASRISWLLQLVPRGNLSFSWRDSANKSFTSSAVPPFVDGGTYWVRVTLDVDNGAGGHTLRFYYSIDYDPATGAGAWIQIGADRVGAGTTFINDSTQQIELGSFQDGGASSPGMWIGRIYGFELRDGIDGPVVAKFDPANDAQHGDTSFQSSTGETWTISQSGVNPAVIDADETYTALNFDIQLPDDLQGKLPRAPIRIDNVGRELTQWIDESKGGRGAQVRVMQVMRDDPDTLEYDVTMDLLSVRQNAAHVTGELGFEDTLNLPALAQTYRPDNTPGIF